MHRYAVREHSSQRRLSHFNSLFTGRGSRVYDLVMVRLTRRLYQRVIADLSALRLAEGQMLDAGTGPGTLVRELARSLQGLPIYCMDLCESFTPLTRPHAKRQHLSDPFNLE